jgi:hypothetical protein
MAHAAALKVPLGVEVAAGDNWEEMTEIPIAAASLA